MNRKIRHKKAQDAELVPSKTTEDKDSSNTSEKEKSFVNNRVISKGLFFKPLPLILLFQTLVIILLCIGFIKYVQNKEVEILSDLNTQIKTLKPQISLVQIEKKFDELEESTRKINTSSIDSVKMELEGIVSQKIDDLGSLLIENEKFVALEENISDLEGKIKEASAMLEVIQTQDINKEDATSIVFEKYSNLLAEIDKRITNQIGEFNKDLNQLGSELTDMQTRLKSIELSNTDKIEIKSDKEFEALESLRNTFSELAYKALKNEVMRNTDDRLIPRMIASIKSQFVMRSVSPKIGFSTDAILSRAEFELMLGNIESCLQEMEYLDDESKKVFSNWIEDMNLLINR